MSVKRPILWIILSVFLINTPAYFILRSIRYTKAARIKDPTYHLTSIIQTGPEKEALKTEFFAEWLGLSYNKPTSAYLFNEKKAKERLLATPFIKTADVKVVFPSSLFIDYTVRTPLAWVSDSSNTAIDEEGALFPIAPFFTPKVLPEIYLGETISFGQKLHSSKTTLAFGIMQFLAREEFKGLITVKKIDVSKSMHPTVSKREVILEIEEKWSSYWLRLTPENYSQELSNYLTLRHLLKEQPLQRQVIDFRVTGRAHIAGY